MTLEADIVAWVNDPNRPEWQKTVFARLCANDVITDDDIQSIADTLLDSSAQARAAKLEVEDIPGSAQSGGESVQLTGLEQVKAVNALVEGQKLTFTPEGLTIIYGDNGSGKSGYARLIRKAVTAKAPLSEVLRNVFVECENPQAATYAYLHGGVARKWQFGAERSRHLSSIRFYDDECGESYITRASVVNYRPSALSLFDRLVNICDQVQTELASRVSELQAQRPELPRLPEGSEAYNFLRDLSADTTYQQFNTASELTKGDSEKLAQKLAHLTRLKASDPVKEKNRLRQVREYWKTVRTELETYRNLVSGAALQSLATAWQDAKDKRDAANLASTLSFENEPIPHVGSKEWRILWEAAREFSTAEAYHDHAYPYTKDGARCVLCQQELSPSAVERLENFEHFVADKTARDAAQAEKVLASRQESLNARETWTPETTTALAELAASDESIEKVKAWLTGATASVEKMLEWLNGSTEKLIEPNEAFVLNGVDTRITQLQTEEDALDEESFKTRLGALQDEIDPLQARRDLARAEEFVKLEVERLKQLNKLEEAQRAVRTTAITRKRTELSSTYVTGLIQEMFIRECEFLNLSKVIYAPAKGRKEVALEHQPALEGAVTKAAVNKVLSEGEQTALGLAGFLTEVELDESRSAVVLDDPVSSLDAQRRSLVASRLVELAKSRQVIVFTHEATFVHMLNKESEYAGIEPIHRTVMRIGEQPGKIADKHPWKVQDVSERIQELTQDLDRLKRDYSTLDDEEYADRASKWGGRLSQLWERTVITDIAYRVVEGGTAEFRPKMFKIIPRVTSEDENHFEAGYYKASWWASRHDQAPERNWQAPRFQEMQTELERVKDWANRLKHYRSK